MPLGNKAKLNDIITTLQEMQGINQRADLKSALVAKEIDALDTDSVAELISKLNSANLVPDGKRWASGTFITKVGTPTVIVSGLTFKPSIVVASENMLNGTTISSSSTSDRVIVIDVLKSQFVQALASTTYSSQSTIWQKNNVVVWDESTGTISFIGTHTNTNYNWYAFE